MIVDTGKYSPMATRLLSKLIGSHTLPNKTIIIASPIVLLIMMTSTIGCIREEDITLEQRMHQLTTQLMCPVCDGQTIDGSNAQISQDMRAKVQELLEIGKSNSEIKDYFVLRYGEDILAAPKGVGFNILAWIMPVFIVFGGISIALLALKNMRRSNTQAALAPTPERRDLSEYLKQVDKDLGIYKDKNAQDQDQDNQSVDEMKY